VNAGSTRSSGNAFFARLIHVEPRRLMRLLVTTSEFHSERTEEIFRWLFNRHAAYAVGATVEREVDPETLETY